MIRIKRVYEPVEASDGFRVLVDGLWPRGFTREKLKADLWLKAIAPTRKLRQWFGHDPSKWETFLEQYHEALAEKEELLSQLLQLEQEHQTLTLLFAARDEQHNHAMALKMKLDEMKQPS